MTPGLTTNCIINHQCIDTKHEVFLLHIKVSLECAETTTVTELDYSLKVDWISHFWDLLDMTIWSHVVTKKNVNLVVMWNDANTVIFFLRRRVIIWKITISLREIILNIRPLKSLWLDIIIRLFLLESESTYVLIL